MYSRLLEHRAEGSFFLFGPRGTGKSTWVRSRYPDALVLDLLDASICNPLRAHPERLRDRIPPDFDGWVVLDEIQKVPAVLDEVHRLIESEGHRFVLTGSSARKLRRSGVNLLAGRALTLEMSPLAAAELGADFDLERAIRFGHLPMACTSPRPGPYLDAYVQTYLREEVLQEALVRDLGAFSRFLEAASFSQGAMLNVSNVARECAVKRKTAEGWFEILEDLLIGVRLPVFARRARRRMVAHPKFYLFDAGVYRAIRPAGPLDRPHEIDGAACETLFFQELRAVNDALGLGYSLHYWRTSSGLEVDFVLYGERGVLAFEVKCARRVDRKDWRGLRALQEEVPVERSFLAYGGTERLYRDGIEIVPLAEILPMLPELLRDPTLVL